MEKRKDYAELPDITLKTVFQAMMYVATKEGEEVDEKYLKMWDHLVTENDLSVTDMMDNIENVYKALKEVGIDENEDDEDEDEDDD